MKTHTHTDWYDFLTDLGAVVTDDHVQHYGSATDEQQAALNGAVLCDLSHEAVICAGGKEAETFLQGQLSNDTRLIDAQHSQLSAYSTPKGRMLALLRLFKHTDSLHLRLPHSLLEITLKRLRMFVMRSKVTLEDRSTQLVRFGLSGAQTEAWLNTHLGSVAKNNDEVVTSNGITQIRVAGAVPRFELYGEPEAMIALWKNLQQHGAMPAGADVWALLEIQAGIPSIHPATQEAFVAQMTNLQFLNGISFKKGCYTGQEIIARMQYLGKVKRRMYLIHINTDSAKAGDGLFSPTEKSAQGTGKIVDARPHPDGGMHALAVIAIASAENQSVHLHSIEGPKVTILDLPYSLEEQ
ncbi:MAG: folate-binding protein YgfZ [Gammaproteobacteria bacterium]|nr:folate-binding protein YgfZ [Gammaproteobacteria bacterium]